MSLVILVTHQKILSSLDLGIVNEAINLTFHPQLLGYFEPVEVTGVKDEKSLIY